MWNKISSVFTLNILSVITSLISGFFFLPFLIKNTSKEEFGILSLLLGIQSINGLFDFGLKANLLRDLSASIRLNQNKETHLIATNYHSMYILAGSLACITFIACSFFILYFKIDTSTIFKNCIIITICYALIIFQSFYFSTYYSFFSATQNLKSIQKTNIYTTISFTILNFYIIYLGFNIYAIAISNLIAQSINNLYVYKNFRLTFPNIGVKFNIPQKTFLKENFKLNRALFISQFSDFIVRKTDLILISIFLPLSQVSIYEIGVRIYNYLRIPLEQLNASIYPNLNDVNFDENQIYKSTKFLSILFIPPVIGFALLGKEFLNLWVGTDFEQAYVIMLLLSSSTIFHIFDLIPQWLQIAQKNIKYLELANIAAAIINLVFCILLIKTSLGIIGVAYANLITIVIVGTPFGIYMRKKTNTTVKSFFVKSISPAIIPTFFWFIVVFYSKNIEQTWFNFSLKCILFIASYAIIYASLYYKSQEIKYIRKKFKFI